MSFTLLLKLLGYREAKENIKNALASPSHTMPIFERENGFLAMAPRHSTKVLVLSFSENM